MNKQLDNYFQQEADAKRFSGSVLIAKEGEILLRKSFGFADYETGKKNEPSNLYILGSMTKAFVAMSILMLEDRGFFECQ